MALMPRPAAHACWRSTFTSSCGISPSSLDVGSATPGDKLKLEIIRKGERRELTAVLGAADVGKSPRAEAEPKASKSRLGLAVRPLTPEERKQVRVQGGLLVEEAGGVAARAGLQAGDIVLMAGGKAVQSVDDLRAATAANTGTVALLVQRGDARVFVPMRLG